MQKILTLLFIAVIYTSSAQKTDLSLNLEKGEVYRQTTVSEATIVQDINGQTMQIKMTIHGTMAFTVEAVGDSHFAMAANYESLRMSMEMPQASMEFSSESNDPNDIFSTILGAMVNKDFDVKISKQGKIIEINRVDELWSAAIDQFTELPEAQKEQIRDQVMKAYGPKALKGSIEMVTAIYPETEVSQGDTWTIDTDLEAGMSAAVSTRYQFVDLTADYAIIKGTSTIKTRNKDAYIESNGLPMKYDLTGTMNSEIKVDRKTGWIIEAAISQDIGGDAFIKENAQLPEGLKIPMTMKNKTRITN